MTSVLEEELKGYHINDFSRKCIEESAMSEDAVRATYKRLRSIGLSDSKIASRAELLGREAYIIDRNYLRLSSLGLSDSKIASQAHLLGRDPNTIDRNYQHHIGLLRQDCQNRNSGRDMLFRHANLLGVSPDTLEANVQWFTERNLDYSGWMMLLGTTPQTKRKKLAWILKEVFDIRRRPKEQGNEIIGALYDFIRDNPCFLIKSIRTLEEEKDKLRKKAEKYKN